MTEEDFLKRWSRRKREVEFAKPIPPEAKTDETESAAPEHAASNEDGEARQAEFDPATLPPIESITAISDVTAFLRAGVPVELTRAALRRVWTADPAIRNFVGLAENAWDFTDPNAMPGFGPLESTDEVRRMIAQVIDQIGEAARPQVAEAQPASADVSQNSNDSSVVSTSEPKEATPARASFALEEGGEPPAEEQGNQVLLHSNKEDDAVQRDVTEDADKPKQLAYRIHGTALPR